MNQESTIPPSWYLRAERIKKRTEREKQIKKEGGNKFQQLEARLTDLDSCKLMECVVIYAIRTIDDVHAAEDFLNGYISDVQKNPHKYPVQAKQDPADYARDDLYLALNMHFTSKNAHQLWNGALKKNLSASPN